MSIGQFALQESIYNTLSNDNTLTSTLGAGIYDDVIEGATYPWIEIGNETSIDYSTKNISGSQYTVTLHIWSRYAGSKEVKQIMDRLHDLLHDSDITVTGFNLINVRFEFGDIMRDPDGKTRHGVMRFRAIILGN